MSPRGESEIATRRRVACVFNPTAGRRRRRFLAAVRSALAARGCAVEVMETQARGDAEAMARRAAGDEFDAIVVAGGDGTINEAINGMAGAAAPLAIVPMGTANVLANEIGLAIDPGRVAEAIVRGPVRRIALGRVAGGRFALFVGAGFDAHVVERVEPAAKRRWGKLAYVAASLAELAKGAERRYRVVVDGIAHDAASVVTTRGRFYAGRYVLAPQARLDESTLWACLFESGGRAATARYAASLLAGGVSRLSDVKIVRATRVEIDGPAGEPVQVDGDLALRLPIVVDLAPETVGLVYPP